MLLKTRHFGDITIDKDNIITFNDGIPSFENVKKYVVLDNPNNESPFKWLQSVDEPDLAFAIINPFLIKADYDIDLDDDAINALDIEKEEEVLIYSIVVVPEDVSRISMNLKAPVVINSRSKKAMQVVLDTDKYSVRHYILEELRKQRRAENACTDKKEGSVHSNR